jgi:hypothetical protein
VTLRLVPDPEPCAEVDAADGVARAVELRAELVAARLRLAYWQARVVELEAALPVSSPLRRGSAGA